MIGRGGPEFVERFISFWYQIILYSNKIISLNFTPISHIMTDINDTKPYHVTIFFIWGLGCHGLIATVSNLRSTSEFCFYSFINTWIVDSKLQADGIRNSVVVVRLYVTVRIEHNKHLMNEVWLNSVNYFVRHEVFLSSS